MHKTLINPRALLTIDLFGALVTGLVTLLVLGSRAYSDWSSQPYTLSLRNDRLLFCTIRCGRPYESTVLDYRPSRHLAVESHLLHWYLDRLYPPFSTGYSLWSCLLRPGDSSRAHHCVVGVEGGRSYENFRSRPIPWSMICSKDSILKQMQKVSARLLVLALHRNDVPRMFCRRGY